MAACQSKPVYAIVGTDDFLRDQARVAVTAEALGQGDPQLGVSRYDSTAELADVLDDVRTLPFLGDRRVVIVDPADEFVSAHRDALEKYLDSPAATGTLVLMLKSLPATQRLAKALRKIDAVIDCEAPDARGAGRFLRERARAAGRQIESPAAELMVQWLGSDLARIASELDKLVLYTDGRGTITVEDVGAVVVATAQVNPFAITDALTLGDARRALETLEKVLTQAGEEYRLLGMLGWHLRRVLKAKHLIDAGRPETQVFGALKVPEFRRTEFRRLLASRSLAQIAQDFRQLIRADLAMKTGTDGKAALQRLVVALC